MPSDTSVVRYSLVWKLVHDCLIEIEASSDNGLYHFPLHQVHSLFRDTNRSSTSEYSEHLQHPKIIVGKATAEAAPSLFRHCGTGDDTFHHHEMPVEIDFPWGFVNGPQVKVKVVEGVFKILDRLPVPKVGFLSKKTWFLVCVDEYALLMRAIPAQPHTKVAYVNLNRMIGNTDGKFDFTSSRFLSTARNVKLDGVELSADLRDQNGEWTACSFNVKEHVQSFLMIGNPGFAQFDDMRVFPNHGPPLAVEKMLSSPKTPLYNNLYKEKNQIRLCKILPGEWNDPIEIHLITWEPESNLAYECLSYVWGSRSDITQISVDGHVFGATVNLWSALQQLRLRGSDKPIWIDAISINQQDNSEKSWQVARMGLIYDQADTVVAYFCSIESLHQRVDEHSPAADILSLEVVCNHLAVKKHLLRIPGISDDSTGGAWVEGPQFRNIVSWLRVIRAHPWWSRVWTLQELIISENLICLFGPIEIKWSTLTTAAHQIYQQMQGCENCRRVYRLMAPEILDVFQSWSENILLLELCRQIPRTPGLGNPDRWNATLTILSQAQRRICFDERDKVFGLLAMIPPYDAAAPILVPNYDASVERIYIDFTLNLIATSASLAIWDLVSSKPPATNGTKSFPSWAIDWRIRNSPSGSERVQMTRTLIMEFPSAAPVRLPLEFLDDQKSLIVEGAKVDVLQAVSESIWPTRAIDTRAEFARVLKEWMAMIESLTGQEYVLGGEVGDAFWRTMFYDHAKPTSEEWSDGTRLVRARDKDKKVWEEWAALVLGESGEGPSTAEGNERQATAPFSDTYFVLEIASGRKLFTTKKGLIGIGPADAQPGDECFALRSGTHWLYLLRPSLAGSSREHRTDCETHHLIGPAYVHGMMDGRRDELIKNSTRIYVE